MNPKATFFFSLGISGVLISVAIRLLYRHMPYSRLGDHWWHLEHHQPALISGMGLITLIFWVVAMGALILMIAGVICGVNASRKDAGTEPKQLMQWCGDVDDH